MLEKTDHKAKVGSVMYAISDAIQQVHVLIGSFSFRFTLRNSFQFLIKNHIHDTASNLTFASEHAKTAVDIIALTFLDTLTGVVYSFKAHSFLISKKHIFNLLK